MVRPLFFKRQYLIQKSFQGKFIFIYAASVSIIVGLATWLLYLQINGAVEKHLYRTHIQIEKVGDFLVELLFSINFYALLAVVVVTLLISIFVFRAINRRFEQMEQAIAVMGAGNLSQPLQQGHRFADVGELSALLEKARLKTQADFNQISHALDDLERGLSQAGSNEDLKRGRDKLDEVLRTISQT